MDRRDASEAYLQPPLPTFPQAPEGEMAWRNPDLQTPHGEMASWFPKFLQSLFPGGANRDTAESFGNLLSLGAAIGVPGGAPKTKPHPKPVDLRKIANDYVRFVMGKAPAPLKEPDPHILRQLQNPGQRTTTLPWVESDPPHVRRLSNPGMTGAALPAEVSWAFPGRVIGPDEWPGWTPLTMPATRTGHPLMTFAP